VRRNGKSAAMREPVGAAMTRQPKAARPDPMLATWDRYVAAEKAKAEASRALETARDQAKRKGFETVHPELVVGPGFPVDRELELTSMMKRRSAERQRQRKAAGLGPHERAAAQATKYWRTALKALATTRATTVEGVLIKLRFVAKGMSEHSDFDGEIIKSAVADLTRLWMVEGSGEAMAKRTPKWR
jgi:hypothetical protein